MTKKSSQPPACITSSTQNATIATKIPETKATNPVKFIILWDMETI